MQVGAIMSGPPWRVGLRTTQEVSPPPYVRQPRRCLLGSRVAGRPTGAAVTRTAGSGPRAGRRTTRACGRRRRRSGTRGSARCAGCPRRHARSVRSGAPAVQPARRGGRPGRSADSISTGGADAFVRAFAAVSVSAHNLCGRLSRAQGLCGNPEGCADGSGLTRRRSSPSQRRTNPAWSVAYANWYFQG